VQARLQDTKAAEEVRALDNFYKILTNEPLKAFYGPKHVMRAAEAQAIEVLLISDKLFRAQVSLDLGYCHTDTGSDKHVA
jgi:protein pelota